MNFSTIHVNIFQFLYHYYSKSYHTIYHGLLITGLITGWLNRKKLIPACKYLLLLLLLTLTNELSAAFCGHYLHNYNFIYNSFTFIQYFLLSYAYYQETLYKKYLFVSNMLLIAFGIFNLLTWQPFLMTTNTYTLMLENLLIIIWVMFFLSKYFIGVDRAALTDFPLFWVSVGWLVFSIVSVISFGFIGLAFNASYWTDLITNVRIYSNYLLYTSFISSFLCRQKSLNDFTSGKW